MENIDLTTPEKALAYLESLPDSHPVELPDSGQVSHVGHAIHMIAGIPAHCWAEAEGRWCWNRAKLVVRLKAAIPPIKVTLEHPASKFGVPVIVDHAACLLDYREGLKVFRRLFGLSKQAFADLCGVKLSTIDSWERKARSINPSAAALNVMAMALKSWRPVKP